MKTKLRLLVESTELQLMSAIKNFFKGQVKFCVQGLPLSCLNRLRNYHISYIKVNQDVIIFFAPLLYCATIKKLISNFEYKVTENYNIFRGVNFLINHTTLIIAVLIAAIFFCFADMRIYRVHVQCNDANTIPAVYEHLNELGVKKFMWKNKLQSFDLAADLVGSFDNLAHAHVRISGNTLVVNLVAATNHASGNKKNFYAQYDAVIKEITVYSGKALVTAGDVVKKGDLLVADAYPDSVVVTGEVAFISGEQISRLVIWII